MPSKQRGGLETLELLRSKLVEGTHIEVLHPSASAWPAYFTFHEAATDDDIAHAEQALGVSLPETYKVFLRRYNGARLYYDNEYLQWGFQLYGTGDIASQNEHWRHVYEEIRSRPYIVFEKSFGDVELLAFDTSQPTKDGKDYRVTDISSIFPRDWEPAAPSFDTWLERLIVAQGEKYWQWYA